MSKVSQPPRLELLLLQEPPAEAALNRLIHGLTEKVERAEKRARRELANQEAMKGLDSWLESSGGCCEQADFD
jgi:hypothetical protein